jgi:hypothetical protein
MADFQPQRHRAHTERALMLGGFGMLLVLGSALVALFFGAGVALVAAGTIGAVMLLGGLLYLVLAGLERLAQ